MKQLRLGILGLGTVGAGTIEMLQSNASDISRRCGTQITVVAASARDLSKDRDCDLSGLQLSANPMDVVNNPDVDAVVELIGGYDLAKELVLAAIENGKHVITANKALIAFHGKEVFAAAEAKGVVVAYEAAVAGGIPIIKAIREGLAGNQIEAVAGIINGTTNFILSEIREKGRAYDDVLKEAQALGYAEADPTFDVGGIDAAHKLTIMASCAYGIPLQFESCVIEGIESIQGDDVKYADELGFQIKHLGLAIKTEQGVEMRVHPTLLPSEHLLANVNGVMNAVLVKGNRVGETMYYGGGAGAGPTASAVVADIIDLARSIAQQVPYLGYQQDQIQDLPALTADQFQSAYYLRLQVSDQSGVMNAITQALATQGISIEALLQKDPRGGGTATVALITDKVVELSMRTALAQLEQLDAVSKPITMLRVERFQ
jgi:homoserine dehydrogenase